MRDMKTCMVTGHRSVSLEKIAYVKQKLRKEIILAIENGYIHFVSGFAEGCDLIFADIVVELKEQYVIKLEAPLPYPNRINTKNSDFQRLLGKCDVVRVHSEVYRDREIKIKRQNQKNNRRQKAKATKRVLIRQRRNSFQIGWKPNRNFKRIITFFIITFKMNIGIIFMPSKSSFSTERASRISLMATISGRL